MMFDVRTVTEFGENFQDNMRMLQNHYADTTAHVATLNPGLRDVTSAVAHGLTVHWMSNGDWSMHQLLGALLDLTGPADVYISSYAFSEQPARSVATWKAEGKIRALHCLLDSRIDVRSASALTQIQNLADRCKLCATHAKVTVLLADGWQLAVIGSANYTTNKRYECGLISTNPGVVQFHLDWINHELQH